MKHVGEKIKGFLKSTLFFIIFFANSSSAEPLGHFRNYESFYFKKGHSLSVHCQYSSTDYLANQIDPSREYSMLPGSQNFVYHIEGDIIQLSIIDGKINISLNGTKVPNNAISFRKNTNINILRKKVEVLVSENTETIENLEVTLDVSRLTNKNKNSINLDPAQFRCVLTTNYAELISLRKKTEYIFVHPQARYDSINLISSQIEKELLLKSQPIILLDLPKYDGGFFIKFDATEKTIDTSHLLNKGVENSRASFQESLLDFGEINISIPESSTLLYSPSGHNSFAFSKPNHTVVYTGGFFNFCMFNNTISLVRSFLKSSIAKELTIVYDTRLITVQGPSSEKVYLKGYNNLSFYPSDLSPGYDLRSVFNKIGKDRSRKYLDNYFRTVYFIMGNEFNNLNNLNLSLRSKSFNLNENYSINPLYKNKETKTLNMVIH